MGLSTRARDLPERAEARNHKEEGSNQAGVTDQDLGIRFPDYSPLQLQRYPQQVSNVISPTENHLEQVMPSLTRLLKVSAIGLVLISLAGCYSTYVRERHQEAYAPAYRPIQSYAPSYSVQYYSPAPVYVERRTVFVPSAVVLPPRVIHSDDHRQHGRDVHARNQHAEDWDSDRGGRSSTHLNRVERNNPVQVTQQNRNDAAKDVRPRDGRRERNSDRSGEQRTTAN